jgi:nucleoside-diphosphate-sugar epimerase
VRILVTGGAGYIGSILVRYLLAEGHDVTVLDNFMYQQTPFNDLCVDSYFNVVNGDARDFELVSTLGKDAEVIIPLAALVGAPLCDRDKEAAVSTNCSAVGMLTRLPSKKVIIPISNSGYGIGEAGKECTEESPLRPISLYGKTKVDAERVIMLTGNAISLRLATVFGMSPRMRLDLLVNDFVWRAVHDRAVVLFEADFKRNYIHVRDVARAFRHCIVNFNQMKGQIYNVGLSSANLSKRELCGIIRRHIPQFVALEASVGEDPDKRDYIVSNTKFEAMGWWPKYDLDFGVRELIKGYAMLRNTVHGNV